MDEKLPGQEYAQQSITEAWTPLIRVREYGDLLPIEGSTMEDIQNKVGDVLKKWVKEWGLSARQTKEYFIADILSYGGYAAGYDKVFDNSDPTGAWTDASGDGIYDGTTATPMAFFNLTGNPRTASNGDTYFNLRSGLALNYAGIVNLYELIAETNAFKENGEKIYIMPDCMVVGTPTSEFTAKRILTSEKIAGTAMNDRNVIQNLLKVIRNPFLTAAVKTANAYVIGKAKAGIKIYSRIEPEFEFFEEKKSNIFYARIRLRCGAGVTNWRYWAANDLPTS